MLGLAKAPTLPSKRRMRPPIFKLLTKNAVEKLVRLLS